MLCKQGLRNLRSEVSKVYCQSVAACFFDILQSLYHMDLTFHDTDRTFIDILFPIFCLISLHQGFPSGYGEALRETISAHCYNTDFQFWHILHSMYSPFFFIDICPKLSINSFLAALNSRGSSPYSHKNNIRSLIPEDTPLWLSGRFTRYPPLHNTDILTLQPAERAFNPGFRMRDQPFILCRDQPFFP